MRRKARCRDNLACRTSYYEWRYCSAVYCGLFCARPSNGARNVWANYGRAACVSAYSSCAPDEASRVQKPESAWDAKVAVEWDALCTDSKALRNKPELWKNKETPNLMEVDRMDVLRQFVSRILVALMALTIAWTVSTIYVTVRLQQLRETQELHAQVLQRLISDQKDLSEATKGVLKNHGEAIVRIGRRVNFDVHFTGEKPKCYAEEAK